jgi:hypothetical protein
MPDQFRFPILESGARTDHVGEKSTQCVTASAFSVSRPSGTSYLSGVFKCVSLYYASAKSVRS